MKIIIAAGHGGGDSGAVAQNTTEAAETIQIVDKIEALIGNKVELLVVPHDLGLVDSIAWANKNVSGLEDALAIEVHKNAGGGTGNEVWCPSNSESISFITNSAAALCSSLAAATGLKNRGVKYAQNNRYGRLGWTDDTTCYALLVEAGFIDIDEVGSNANDKYATGIANAILNILEKEKVEMSTEKEYNEGDAVNIAALTGCNVDEAKSKGDWNNAFYSIVDPYINKVKTKLAKLEKTTPDPDTVNLLNAIKKLMTKL